MAAASNAKTVARLSITAASVLGPITGMSKRRSCRGWPPSPRPPPLPASSRRAGSWHRSLHRFHRKHHPVLHHYALADVEGGDFFRHPVAQNGYPPLPGR